MLDVLDKEEQKYGDFTTIYKEMHNGGLEAMLYDLLEYDLSGFNIRDVPQTEGLAEQKLRSLSPLAEWWFGVLVDGSMIKDTQEKIMHEVPMRYAVRCDVLFENYLLKVGQTGGRRSMETTFGIGFKKLIPPGVYRKVIPVDIKVWDKEAERYAEERVEKYHYCFPHLDRCREYFAEKLGMKKYKWEKD